jgi:hypothetical protein
MRLLAKQWRIIAKALRFARDLCEEPEAQPILDIIGEHGEKAAPAPTEEESTSERTD